MNRKKLIQKLQQLMDIVKKPKQKQKVYKDLLELKLSKEDKLFIELKDKYDGFHN
jgi:Tfp pilus assembly protein PilN